MRDITVCRQHNDDRSYKENNVFEGKQVYREQDWTVN